MYNRVIAFMLSFELRILLPLRKLIYFYIEFAKKKSRRGMNERTFGIVRLITRYNWSSKNLMPESLTFSNKLQSNRTF